jgi:hypothetical protein
MPILGIIASSFRSAAGPVGAYDSLATITIPSGGLSSVTFAGIPSGYKHLQIRVFTRSTTTTFVQSALTFRANGDTGTNYSFHQVGGDGSSTFASGTANTSSITTVTSATANGSTSTFGAGIIDVLDYADINKFKTIRCLSGLDLNGTPSTISLRSGAWRNTSAITSITLTESNNNIAEFSSIALYGVK